MIAKADGRKSSPGTGLEHVFARRTEDPNCRSGLRLGGHIGGLRHGLASLDSPRLPAAWRLSSGWRPAQGRRRRNSPDFRERDPAIRPHLFSTGPPLCFNHARKQSGTKSDVCRKIRAKAPQNPNAYHIRWLGSRDAAIPPINGIEPMVNFEVAFDGEQGIGFSFQPAASRLIKRYGMHPRTLLFTVVLTEEWHHAAEMENRNFKSEGPAEFPKIVCALGITHVYFPCSSSDS